MNDINSLGPTFQSGPKIFNCEHGAATIPLEFPLFSHLPKEIRLEIWQHALRRGRFILVDIKADPADEEHGRRMRMDGKYWLFVHAVQTKSKLLRVNRESRKEAQKFYRATFPCQFVRTSNDGWQHFEQGTLSINPEWDILSIYWCYSPVRETFIDFLFRLKTEYDPHGIGLLNLGLCLTAVNVNDLSYLNPRSDLHPDTIPVVVETLMQLREVFFFVIQEGGRIRGARTCVSPAEEFVNHALPIMTSVPSFERLPRDPRAFDENYSISIDSVHVKAAFFLWHEFLRTFDVSPPFVEYKMLLAFDSQTYGGAPVVDLRSAKTFFEKEQATLKLIDRRSGLIPSTPRTVSHTIEPVFGFWLFPMDEFEEYATRYSEVEEDQMENRDMWGWSGTNAELAVTYLS